MRSDLYLETLKKDVEIIKSENMEEIEKRFEPETECKKCHFCYKMNPLYGSLRTCLLFPRILEDNIMGCYSGYKLKDKNNEK